MELLCARPCVRCWVERIRENSLVWWESQKINKRVKDIIELKVIAIKKEV